jgi:hypothetical protein
MHYYSGGFSMFCSEIGKAILMQYIATGIRGFLREKASYPE